jgi:hypothetical protein
MPRTYPRFILMDCQDTKSKGLFCIHTINPRFIAVWNDAEKSFIIEDYWNGGTREEFASAIEQMNIWHSQKYGRNDVQESIKTDRVYSYELRDLDGNLSLSGKSNGLFTTKSLFKHEGKVYRIIERKGSTFTCRYAGNSSSFNLNNIEQLDFLET